MILAIIELIFWPAVVGVLSWARVTTGCTAGLGCTLSTLLLGLAAVML